MAQQLPIDSVLGPIAAELEKTPAIVIQAPPGAGKTTRIPLSLLNAAFTREKKIVMLEPRRLAAVNAARWMAASIGEEVGGTIGYAIRFERKVSAVTRIEVVTEGILTRRLQSDPFLDDVALVIFDEFHERSLHADLALALCREVQQGVRPDLRLVVMSATMDTAAVAALLDDAPVFSVAGKSHPVEVHYLARDPDGDPAVTAAQGVRTALDETRGDLLVFLPGAGEIRRCQRLLEEGALPGAVEICPLYGDLPFAAQERAIMPGERRRVVLATNIAETSLTIEGVGAVIDSGFSRQLHFDPGTGLNRLVSKRISAASAEQRAGRAGRLGPGSCYRLWSRHTQATLVPHTPPEIRRADLTPLALELAQWGVGDAAAMAWLDPPPESALGEGRRLLQRFGAVDGQGRITPHGKGMAAIGTHPRLAHMLLMAAKLGQGALAADLAALIGERDILRGEDGLRRHRSPSDLLDRVEVLGQWRSDGNAAGADPWICRAVDRAARDLRRAVAAKETGGGAVADVETLGLLLAYAFPDRIARQREPGSDRYLLANGRGGRLSPRSAVRDQNYLVAVAMEWGDGGDGLIHLASAVSIDTLRGGFGEVIVRRRVVEWNEFEERMEAREEECLGGLVISARKVPAGEDELQAAMLALVRSRGTGLLHWSPQARQLQQRVLFLAGHFPDGGWPDLSDVWLAENAEQWLAPSLAGIGSLSALKRVDILPLLRGMLTWEQGRSLDEGAPTHVTVPSGSRIALNYGADGPPVLAVKLQELFGLADTPVVAFGRVTVLLHLLSPAGRPIQVTSDLRSFWDAVYPQVKRELKGRYPKHPWPDDPWNAEPTRHTKRRDKS